MLITSSKALCFVIVTHELVWAIFLSLQVQEWNVLSFDCRAEQYDFCISEKLGTHINAPSTYLKNNQSVDRIPLHFLVHLPGLCKANVKRTSVNSTAPWHYTDGLIVSLWKYWDYWTKIWQNWTQFSIGRIRAEIDLVEIKWSLPKLKEIAKNTPKLQKYTKINPNRL